MHDSVVHPPGPEVALSAVARAPSAWVPCTQARSCARHCRHAHTALSCTSLALRACSALSSARRVGGCRAHRPGLVRGTVVTEHSLLRQNPLVGRARALCPTRRVAWSRAPRRPRCACSSVATWALCHDKEPKVSISIETLCNDREPEFFVATENSLP